MLQQLLPRNLTADQLKLAYFQCLLVLRQPCSSHFLACAVKLTYALIVHSKVKEQIEHIVPLSSVSADLLDI